jgi:hypothetical protein
MPSTYTLNNGITLIATGEQSGTWGATTNVNLELVDTALDGQVTVTLASAGSSGSPNALPISDGAASNGRNRMVIFDDGGDLGATAYVQLTPNDSEKIIYVRNALSGSRSILLFQGTYNASNDYEVPAGTTAVVYFNGGGTGAVAANVFNNAYFDSLRLGSVSVTSILDEDNMASDSATALATQQSIKAYVDSQVGTVDTLAEILANGNTTGGTNIVVSSGDAITTNTISETTAASGVTIDSLLVKDGGITAAGTSTFAGQTITNLGAVTTADINGGTIDGTVIGGSSAAAGTFTTFTSTGIDDNATSTALTISSADNVGVGTATPDRLFEVDEASGDAYVRLRASDTGGGADTIFENLCADNAQNNYIYFGDLDDVDIGTIRYSHASNFMSFTINAAERMRITSSGNVGIGTTSPVAQFESQAASGTLQTRTKVTGSTASDIAELAISTGTRTHLIQSKGSSGDFVIRDSTGAADRITMNTSGNVGIGTSSPASRLTVSDGTASGLTPFGDTDLFLNSSGDNYLQFGSGTSSSPAIYFGDSADGDAGGIIYAHATDAMSFRTNAAERMRIDSSGNVGIGNAAPSYLLDLYKAASTVVRIRNSAATGGTPSATHGEFVIESTDANMGMQFLGSTTADQRILFTDTAAVSGQIVYNHTSNYMALFTNAGERMRIDSSGNVGIGTSSPSTTLHISTGLGNGILLEDNNTSNIAPNLTIIGKRSDGNGSQCFGGKVRLAKNQTNAAIDAAENKLGTVMFGGNHTNSSISNILYAASMSGISEGVFNSSTDMPTGLAFYTGSTGQDGDTAAVTVGTERMRIDSSGNVGIGVSPGAAKLQVNNSAATHTVLYLQQTNTSYNTDINLYNANNTTSSTLVSKRTTGDLWLYQSGANNVGVYTNATERVRIESGGVVRPGADNTQTLGSASFRWSVVYAGTGTINTSDEREKQQIANLDDAERRVAVAIKGLVKKYKYNDAVALKGDDARIHVGVIAQEVIAAFAAEGLDATRYALLCHDTWEAKPEETDDEGNVINPGIEAGERYGIRYDELLAFMIAAL